MKKTFKTLFALSITAILSVTSSLSASAASVGVQTVTDSRLSAGPEDINRLTVSTFDDFPTSVFFQVALEQLPIASNFDGNYFASVTVDIDGDEIDDYWIPSPSLVIPGVANPTWIIDIRNGNFNPLDCDANFYLSVDSPWLAFETDQSCLELPETFGVFAYATNKLSGLSDFAPDFGYLNVVNPTYEIVKVLESTPTPVLIGSATVGKTLMADTGIWDSGVAINIQWLRNGAEITGQTGVSYTLSPSDWNRSISVEVTGSLAGYESVTKLSASKLVSTGTMSGATPKITGTAKVGSVVKVSTTKWVSGAKVTYKWLAKGVAIKGATSSSLKLTSAMKGKKITVVVTQAATGYKTVSKTSSSVTVK